MWRWQSSSGWLPEMKASRKVRGQLGVASAAVASLVSLIVAMGWLASYLLRRRHPLAPDAALLRRASRNAITSGAVRIVAAALSAP